MVIHKKQGGFSLIELLVVIAIFAIVIIMSSDTFTIILRQTGQEVGVVGSQIDNIIGLNIMLSDIEHAGYGLPWLFQSTINYSEAASAPASNYNNSPSNPPKAIIAGNNAGYNNSDYLVIRSTVVGTSDAAQRWTYIIQGQNPKVWDSAMLNLSNGNRIIVIKPKVDANTQNQLVMDGATFFTQFNSSNFPAGFSPQEVAQRFLIYGVDPDTNLRMPFNRADYYVSASNMPASCAPNTGVLYKATVNHSNGQLNEMPLIDCVADMQVIFRLDTDSDGVVNSQSNDISAFTAQQIREQVKEVRVYILAHEGKRDQYYTHSPSVITVGEYGLGRDFDLAANIGTGWQNYRWKVYTLVAKPRELYQY
jgi:prepilin-type N-terminal cleavage/methylation domain-containing protein